MTIRTKMLAILAAIMSLAGLAGVLVLLELLEAAPQLRTNNANAERIADTAVPLYGVLAAIKTDVVQVQQWLTDISATRGRDGLDDGFDQAERHAKAFVDDVARARSLAVRLGAEDVVVVLDRLAADFPPFYAAGKTMAQAYVERGPDGGNGQMADFDAVAETLYDSLDDLAVLNVERIDDSMRAIVSSSRTLREEIEGLTTLMLIMAPIGALLGIAGAVWLVLLIRRAIDGLRRDIAVVQERRPEPLVLSRRRDEFGAIGLALEDFRGTLAHADQLERDQAAEREAAEGRRRELLDRLASEIETNVQSVVQAISGSSAEMHAAAEAMADIARDTTGQARDVARAAEDAAGSVETVAAAAEELAASIAEIGRQVTDSADISRAAVERAAEAESTVQGLAQAAERIGAAVKLITDIAEQTNLLALNATIEAARAGDAGKGFAVVANEVKSLAGQTARATEEISRQIADVQAETDRAVSAIGAISGTIGQINQIAGAIAAAVEEQGAATREIARNVQQAAEGTQTVTGTIGRVDAAAAETGQTAAQVLHSAESVTAQAGVLSERVTSAVAHIRAS